MTAITSAPNNGGITKTRQRVSIRGAVQGVGFRPFVYRQATALGVAGWVENSSQGVTVEAEGPLDNVFALVKKISNAAPPNAVITSTDTQEIVPLGDDRFVIRESDARGARSVQVLPDLATCADCLAELLDPSDRRFLYPFINCTQCGPRYSIVESIPYDRARTAMRHFEMCDVCRAEYTNPMDRRFHAEPNACADCGPRLALWDETGTELCSDHEALLHAAAAIRDGCIVATKGIGGFHLIVDARNESAVIRLRTRKRREDKPFAVLFSSLSDILENCIVSPQERALLEDAVRPIVLLTRSAGPVCEKVAPGGNPCLGALLPYSPLHQILMRELGFPVVATSGNSSGEPIVTENRDALRRLSGIADLFLVHDREIVRPVDDSVVRHVSGRELVLRRARGYAPVAVAVENLSEGILAVGGHLKTTVALTRKNEVILSQHLGDQRTVDARIAHERATDDVIRLHGIQPRLVACDLHPDYATTRAAETTGLRVAPVQHHLAHVVSCMAEHDIVPPVLGVAWDGTGYGADGTVWGGEFLEVTQNGWRRVAHLRPFRLLGGEAVASEPRRAALGLLYEAYDEDAFEMTHLDPVDAFTAAERTVLCSALLRKLNSPVSTSVGRLFDAFAALCGLRQRVSYEGQAAAEFEWAAKNASGHKHYEFLVRKAGAPDAPMIIDWQPALDALIADVQSGENLGLISSAVHTGLSAAIGEIAAYTGQERIVLTGGCFQNARLTEATIAALRDRGHEPVWHQRIPPNDGGLALGQAVWASWTEAKEREPCA
jgi:hydrogenase maturation protein HypF